MNVSSVKNLNGGVLSAVQDASLTNVIQTNSGNWQDITAYQNASATYLKEVSIPESATWNEVSTTVQTNSAQWGQGGSSDTFYIYPGKTTDKEIAENSGKDLKLYNSANNVFLDFAGKSTLQNYTTFSFKEITGTQSNQNTLQHLRLRVYPNATSACKVFDTNTVNLLDSNSTVSTAQTAYYDAGGRDLSQTHDDLTALNQFVQSNSASWGGGSSPTGGDSVLFRLYYNDNYGSTSTNSYISGATELYFEASMDYQQGSPNDVIITKGGSEVGRASWSQVSSDGNVNYFTASYYNPDAGEIGLHNNGNYYQCYVSSNGFKTNAFGQRSYYCKTNDTIKINVQGSNVTGNIIGMDQNHNSTPLTSFTGSLSNFTAKGYSEYNADIFYEDSTQPFYYEVSAELGGGGVGGEVSHDNTLSGNGTVDSPLGVVPGYNETVLWSGSWKPGNGSVVTNSAIEISEPVSNFEYIKVVTEGILCQTITVTPNQCQAFICYPESDDRNSIIGLKISKDDDTHIRFRCGYSTDFIQSYRSGSDWGYFTLNKIIGINRKQ